jgi:hypothetical protein
LITVFQALGTMISRLPPLRQHARNPLSPKSYQVIILEIDIKVPAKQIPSQPSCRRKTSSTTEQTRLDRVLRDSTHGRISYRINKVNQVPWMAFGQGGVRKRDGVDGNAEERK